MENRGYIFFLGFQCGFLLLLSQSVLASIPFHGTLNPVTQTDYFPKDGYFLFSNDSNFAFGFKRTPLDPTLFVLVIVHRASSIVVWTANRDSPVRSSGHFVFGTKGVVSLNSAGKAIWAPNADAKSVSSIELMNSGNLVLLGNENSIIWESFDNPTNSLLSNQDFKLGMKLSSASKPGGNGNIRVRKRINNWITYLVIGIAIVTVIVVGIGIVYWFRGRCCYLRKNVNATDQDAEANSRMTANPEDNSEQDDSLEIPRKPDQYSYNQLSEATNNFQVKLGSGGCGSVFKGVLPDSTPIAVKKLKGSREGEKQFLTEVKIIGSLHHCNVVKLKGFCLEGANRLLAYEFMENGSLDKWIFGRGINDIVLDWGTRFNIMLEIAKGIEYLHENCDYKIVHCDIKPANVLLDGEFKAKLSDFGVAKSMAKKMIRVYTCCFRGTIGYTAPEQAIKGEITAKSDVHSFGVMSLEIIGGRKCYDLGLSPERRSFADFAYKNMEEGRFDKILDSSIKYVPNDESLCKAVKVAFWCIQDDMDMRPSMTDVIQMLKGISPVSDPPSSYCRWLSDERKNNKASTADKGKDIKARISFPQAASWNSDKGKDVVVSTSSAQGASWLGEKGKDNGASTSSPQAASWNGDKGKDTRASISSPQPTSWNGYKGKDTGPSTSSPQITLLHGDKKADAGAYIFRRWYSDKGKDTSARPSSAQDTSCHSLPR